MEVPNEVPSEQKIKEIFLKYDVNERQNVMQSEINVWQSLLSAHKKELSELNDLVKKGFSTPYFSMKRLKIMLVELKQRILTEERTIQNINNVKRMI